ncbi:MAG: S8 family serine peptidase [Methanosarcinaceae archaeon]|nr:S8 family serine peptidase [Methanosarcinaceae archaeon]
MEFLKSDGAKNMSLKTLIAILLITMLAVGTLTPAMAVSSKAYSFEENLEVAMPDVTYEQPYVPGEILVKFNAGVSEANINAINSKNGATVTYTSPYAGFKKLKIPKTKSVEEMVQIYSRNPNVEYAEPNFIASICMLPNDPYYSYQWHLDNDDYGGINMEEAWDISNGTGVTVAVLDTGVAYEDVTQGNSNKYIYKQAPDLAETNFVPGYDFVNNDEHPNDDNNHGTHATGTIAQSTNNNLGVAGVAYNCSIMPVKVLDKQGSGSHSQIADGIYYAANNGAQVISMSLGGPDGSTTLEGALAYAYSKGVTIVCAAGNAYEDGNLPSYPAAYDDYCIAVGATRYDETRSYYSNTGFYLDIAAPGGDLTVNQSGDQYMDGILQQTFVNNISDYDPTEFHYYFFQGTSMATPHVSGVAALVISNAKANGKTLTPDEVREAIESTAEDLGEEGWDEEYGWGLVDAYAAASSYVFPHGQVYDAEDPLVDGKPTSGSSYPLGSSVPFIVQTDNSDIVNEGLTFTITDSDNDVVGMCTVNNLNGNQTREFSVIISKTRPAGEYEIFEIDGKVDGDHFQMEQPLPEFSNPVIPLLAVIGIVFMFRRKE